MLRLHPHRIRLVGVAGLLAIGVAFGASRPSPAWRIMAVGDSITEGGATFSSYRPLLSDLLHQAGYAATFVGSRGPGESRHEGYGGKNAEFLATTVPANFALHPADIVLLHAGHNHFAEEHPVPGIIEATERLITSFRAINPRVTVLLAQVIPAGKLPKYSYGPELNAALAQLADRLHQSGQPVVLVDQATGFDWQRDTIDDHVHPNATGAAKMAHRWFEALQPILATAAPNPGREIHVSPLGDDHAAGTSQQPVATLARAQQLARAELRAGHPATVMLHRGVYYLPEPLVFTSEDSGTAAAPTTWRAAVGEKPVLSGGTRLALNWRPSSLRPEAVEANVPAGIVIDQLWVNGRQQWMARFPNRTPGEGHNVFDTWKLEPKAPPDPGRDPLAPERLARWTDPAGAYLHAMHRALWGGVHWRITGKNADGTLALIGGTQNNRGSTMHKTYRMIENIREELDAPGEWYHDRQTHTLHFFPPAGTDLAHATIETVRLRHLIEIRGSRVAPVRALELRGLTFRHTARTFMETKEPLLRSDWTIYRGGAVYLTGSEDCTLAQCTFDQVGGNAIFASNYHRRLTIRGCLIADAGANGVCFVGNPAAVRNPLFNYVERLNPAQLDRTPGPQSDDFPADCRVEDCLITRTGRVEKQTAGVAIDMAQNITVRHCSIYDVPRAGINLGGGTWGGHLIEFCDVFDTVNETGDHGSFNSWGRDRFWPPQVFKLDDDAFFATHRDLPLLDAVRPVIIRNNRWRCDHGWDIDLDDGSSNYEIRNNLCLRGGIKNREGFHRIVENNIIVGNGFHPHVWYKHSGDIFRRNIVGHASYLPARMPPPPWGAEMDYNLVHTPGLAAPRPAARLAQQSGRDLHSLQADAHFIDAARGDYRVREGSPARQLGFTNFPMDQFGVTSPALRAMARTPSLAPPPATEMVATETAASTWLGARIKSLETPEEASAVGVALAQGGLLVLEAPAGTRAAKAGLRRGDLIVELGGQRVQTPRDAERLLGRPKSGTLSVKVVRDQTEQVLTPGITP